MSGDVSTDVQNFLLQGVRSLCRDVRLNTSPPPFCFTLTLLFILSFFFVFHHLKYSVRVYDFSNSKNILYRDLVVVLPFIHGIYVFIEEGPKLFDYFKII